VGGRAGAEVHIESRLSALAQDSFAAEQEMLNTASTSLHQSVPPTSAQRLRHDVGLTVLVRMQPMKRNLIHRVAERKVARPRVHTGTERLQERLPTGAAAERNKEQGSGGEVEVLGAGEARA
jgi:hypothetical protein